jgi:hypothetical protein
MERLIGDLPFLEVLYVVHFLSKGVLDNNIWFLDHLPNSIGLNTIAWKKQNKQTIIITIEC